MLARQSITTNIERRGDDRRADPGDCMPRKHLRRKQLDSLCADVYEDDGVDPRHERRAGQNEPRDDRKARQLCRVAARAVAAGLAGCDDALLDQLRVVGAQPAPDSSRIRILLAIDAGAPMTERQRTALLGRLRDLRGYLRSLVAVDASRKRAPELCFTWHLDGATDETT